MVEDQLLINFKAILERSLKDMRTENEAVLVKAAELNEMKAVIREVSVLFEDDEAVLRVLDTSSSFQSLKADVCRYFEVHPLEVDLVDDNGELWGSELSVGSNHHHATATLPDDCYRELP